MEIKSAQIIREGERDKRERERERESEREWERERGDRDREVRLNPALRLMLSPNYVSSSQSNSY